MLASACPGKMDQTPGQDWDPRFCSLYFESAQKVPVGLGCGLTEHHVSESPSRTAEEKGDGTQSVFEFLERERQNRQS
jgi:hypothetical protein